MLIWFFVLIVFSNTAMANEAPKFVLLEKDQAFELRAYQPKIIAEVLVEGSMAEASSKGFRAIADFIFGNNKASSGKSEKISMTVPVSIESEDVQQSAHGWKVSFVMPSQYTLETLPKPNNPLVNLKTISAKKFAVIRFSGLVDEGKTLKKAAELKEWTDSKKLKTLGNPQLARYNPPWVLPFLRLNEVMVEVE